MNENITFYLRQRSFRNSVLPLNPQWEHLWDKDEELLLPLSLFSVAFRCTDAVNECSVMTGSLTALSRSRKVGMSQHPFL